MRKTIFAFIVVVSIFFTLTPLAQASGTLELVKDGTTYYLNTTQTSSNSGTVTQATTSSTATTSAFLFGRPLRGYASSLTNLISFALQLVMVVALLLVLLNLVTAGIQWITSGGDKGKVDAARQKIVASFVGILILSASYALFRYVLYILGFESLETAMRNIPPIGGR